jgi:hypothetical protein
MEKNRFLMQISSRTKKESSQRVLNLAVSELRRFSRATVSKLLVLKIRSASCKPRKVYARVKSEVEFDKTSRVLEKNKGRYYVRFLRVSFPVAGGIHSSTWRRSVRVLSAQSAKGSLRGPEVVS